MPILTPCTRISQDFQILHLDFCLIHQNTLQEKVTLQAIHIAKKFCWIEQPQRKRKRKWRHVDLLLLWSNLDHKCLVDFKSSPLIHFLLVNLWMKLVFYGFLPNVLQMSALAFLKVDFVWELYTHFWRKQLLFFKLMKFMSVRGRAMGA